MPTPTNINVRIETRKTDPYECEALDVNAAIDDYIENRLGYESGFALSEATWEVVKEAVINAETTTSQVVELVNGLCKTNMGKITRILSDYTVDFTITALAE